MDKGHKCKTVINDKSGYVKLSDSLTLSELDHHHQLCSWTIRFNSKFNNLKQVVKNQHKLLEEKQK